jgi:pimeloyl-ACP methyl ester carboxylesterase
MMRRRHVFHVGGYDPIGPEEQLGRLRESLSRFDRIWSVSSKTSAILYTTDISSSWDLDAWGPNWNTHVTFEMLRWDDLILDDSRRGMLSRLYHSARTLFDFTMNGTLSRYFRANWKYAGFFIFPYVSIALLGLGSVGMAYVLTRLSGVTGWWAALLGIFIAALTCAALIYWLDPRRRTRHAMDDAIFSRQFLHGERPAMETRIDHFASNILERVQKGGVDEIVIVGHSLGAAMAVAAVARALKLDPQLAAHGTPLCLLTVGATIPKFSLHPKGEEFRQATRAVADETRIRWTEYHARDDVISFYRVDPVILKRITRDELVGRPNIRRVQMPSMMSPESFKRHRFNFMRVHYQFLMGNDLRAAYDYCMIICGPLDFDEITLPDGGLDRFLADGSVVA